MKAEYKTENYNVSKSFLCFFVAFMLIVAILALGGIFLNIPPWICIFGYACLCVSPFIFEKKLKQLFTNKVILELDELSFSVTTYRLDGETIKKRLDFKWSDIKSYKFYFSSAKNTILTIYKKSGGSKSWNFKDNKNYQEALDGESIFNILMRYIKQYNVNKDEENRIILNKGFFNSKAGTIIVYSEIVLLLGALILHIIMQPKSSILTLLVGFSLTAQLFSKRKQEKDLYDKISKL